MTDIQVDMYEVQLGAAVLIQFNRGRQPVRILADAGIHAKQYSRDHVLKKLKPSFNAFNSQTADRIDLLMGSHYDKDHLDGLIDVAADTSIDITEAWLPPVEDDTEDDTGDSGGPDAAAKMRLSDMSLGAKFAKPDGNAAFENYINRQRQICEESLQVREQLQRAWPRADRSNIFKAPEKTEIPKWPATFNVKPFNLESMDVESIDPGPIKRDSASRAPVGSETLEDYFTAQIRAADADIPDSAGWRQADEDVDDFEMIDTIEEGLFSPRTFKQRPFTSRKESATRSFSMFADAANLSDNISTDRELGSNLLVRAAIVRKSAARNAINATSLKKLVDKLNARKIPIRFEQIVQGQPRYFVFDNSGNFREQSKAVYDKSSEPKLTLLGPSDALIKKHKKILPILRTTMVETARIPIKSITPSNQLSYVAKFEHSSQSILISGDTGFVDFKKSRNQPYLKPMLDALDDLHVVQIAHHAGNNAHFYRVLQQAPFGSRVGSAPFFLLSHAELDQFRPSSTFESFVSNLVKTGPKPKLLFTSRPKSAKVKRYTNLIAPVVGPQQNVGDVRLVFQNSKWSLISHAIKV